VCVVEARIEVFPQPMFFLAVARSRCLLFSKSRVAMAFEGVSFSYCLLCAFQAPVDDEQSDEEDDQRTLRCNFIFLCRFVSICLFIVLPIVFLDMN